MTHRNKQRVNKEASKLGGNVAAVANFSRNFARFKTPSMNLRLFEEPHTDKPGFHCHSMESWVNFSPVAETKSHSRRRKVDRERISSASRSKALRFSLDQAASFSISRRGTNSGGSNLDAIKIFQLPRSVTISILVLHLGVFYPGR